MNDPTKKLIDVRLDEGSIVRRSPEVEHERKVAIYDLLEDNDFDLVGDFTGPYKLILGIEENRLVLSIRDSDEEELRRVILSMGPYRKIIKDYFAICESYYEAIKTASPAQIEAIDMGRRGLHNEGSSLLQERLADKMVLNHDTARRLFTLICVLHIR